MAKIKDKATIDRFEALREDLRAALVKHGFRDQRGFGFSVYPDGQVKLKADLVDVLSGKDPREESWRRHCSYFGMLPEHLGMTFEVSGETYRISGFDSSRRAKPVIIERVRDGHKMILRRELRVLQGQLPQGGRLMVAVPQRVLDEINEAVREVYPEANPILSIDVFLGSDFDRWVGPEAMVKWGFVDPMPEAERKDFDRALEEAWPSVRDQIVRSELAKLSGELRPVTPKEIDGDIKD